MLNVSSAFAGRFRVTGTNQALTCTHRSASARMLRQGAVRLALTACAAVMLLVGGCGGDAPPATQLAAKVNKQEISIHQVNQAMARAAGSGQGMSPERVAALRLEVLQRLVDQQLAVDKAIEKKLDRKPDVMLQIEASRREILARSYYEQIASGLPQPEPSEARKYYVEHPQLFAQRRIYRLHEITVGNMEANVDSLRSYASGKPMSEVEAWIKSQKIPYASNVVTRSAEQIPLKVLVQIEQFREGQVGLIETPKAVLVLQLIASRPAPIDESAALPAIRRYLMNKQVIDTVEQDMERLRSQASIEYLNEFAAHTPQSTAAKAAATSASAPAAASASAPGAGADEASTAGSSTVAKDIPGLK